MSQDSSVEQNLPSLGERAQIVQAIIKIGQFMQRDLNHACQQSGLSFNQFSVISEILLRGPISQKDLCERLLLEKSNISKIVKGLIDKGLVNVSVAPLDRRLTMLIETPEGAEYWQACLQKFSESSIEMVSYLSDEDSLRVLKQLKKLEKSLAGRIGK